MERKKRRRRKESGLTIKRGRDLILFKREDERNNGQINKIQTK